MSETQPVNRPAGKPPTNWAWPAAALGAVVVVLAAAVVGVRLPDGPPGPAVSAEVESAPASMPRAEFESLVLGRMRDGVLMTCGKPARVNTSYDVECWTYERKTYILASGRLDNSVEVWFDLDGVAVRAGWGEG